MHLISQKLYLNIQVVIGPNAQGYCDFYRFFEALKQNVATTEIKVNKTAFQ